MTLKTDQLVQVQVRVLTRGKTSDTRNQYCFLHINCIFQVKLFFLLFSIEKTHEQIKQNNTKQNKKQTNKQTPLHPPPKKTNKQNNAK